MTELRAVITATNENTLQNRTYIINFIGNEVLSVKPMPTNGQHRIRLCGGARGGARGGAV